MSESNNDVMAIVESLSGELRQAPIARDGKISAVALDPDGRSIELSST